MGGGIIARKKINELQNLEGRICKLITINKNLNYKSDISRLYDEEKIMEGV